jgi:endoglucanase
MVPPVTGLTGAFNQTYLSGLQTIVSYITGKNGYVLIERAYFLSITAYALTSYPQRITSCGTTTR